MRIIHVIDYFQPQLGYQETFLAREHSESGHDVFVVTSDRYQPALYKGNSQPVMGLRVRETGFSLESGVQVWRLKTGLELPNIIWIKGLENKIREINPDLVIVHGVTSFTAVRIARLKRELGYKLIYDDHATPDNSTGIMRHLYPVFRRTLSRTIQKAADAFVAILPATKEFMQGTYGIPAERITVIPMGADLRLFYYDEALRKETRRKYRFRNEDVVFIYTGKIIPFRQVSVFIDALAELAGQYGNVYALFVGSSEASYAETLRNQIDRLGLSEYVTWVDAVPNDLLYRYYSTADVSVWPYGASVGMREAMSCCLPVIIGEHSMVTELVEHGNGFTFEEENAADLAEKMRALMDRETRRTMGEKSREIVEIRFNWKTIAEQFLELIR